MPVGGNQAFLCLSFASHEGRRWVRVNGHILALCCRGQADKTLILYCQAVLLTFFKQYFDLNLTLSYSVCCCTIPMTIITPHIIAVIGPQFCSHCRQMFSFISANVYLVFLNIILEAGDTCCFTPVHFLHCSLPSTGLSPQQGPAVQLFLLFISKRKTNCGPLYSFNSNNSMFLDNPVCLSVPR